MPRMMGNDGKRRKISVTLSEEAMEMIGSMAESQGGSYVSHVIEDCVRKEYRRWQKEHRRTTMPMKPVPKRSPTKAQRVALEQATKTVSKKRRRREND
jgi:metal-responsive CopG/Arc/MetJ family transcriptional regulator